MKKTTQSFTDSLLFLSKPILWFTINIPLSISLEDNSKCCYDCKGKNLRNCHRGAEIHFSQFKEESKLIKFMWIRDCPSERKQSEGISFQNTDLTAIELHADWEIQLDWMDL